VSRRWSRRPAHQQTNVGWNTSIRRTPVDSPHPWLTVLRGPLSPSYWHSPTSTTPVRRRFYRRRQKTDVKGWARPRISVDLRSATTTFFGDKAARLLPTSSRDIRGRPTSRCSNLPAASYELKVKKNLQRKSRIHGKPSNPEGAGKVVEGHS
jgi:hypothetical protein